jgi:hypothetical protein
MDITMAETLVNWRAYNCARVTRMREGLNVNHYLDDIAGCLGYLRLPLEPVAFVEATARMASLSGEMLERVRHYVAPKLRWSEQHMFSHLSLAAQKDILKSEENEVLIQRLAIRHGHAHGPPARRSKSVASRPPSAPPPLYERRPSDTPRPPVFQQRVESPTSFVPETPDGESTRREERDLEDADSYLPNELLDDSAQFRRARERNKLDSWSNARK